MSDKIRQEQKVWHPAIWFSPLNVSRSAKKNMFIAIDELVWEKGPFLYTGIEGPDQTAHPRSVIRAFIARFQTQWIRTNNILMNRPSWSTNAGAQTKLGISLFAYSIRYIFSGCLWYELPQRQKKYFRICAPADDSDQPVLSHTLIRIFSGHFLDSQGCKVSSSGQRRL